MRYHLGTIALGCLIFDFAWIVKIVLFPFAIIAKYCGKLDDGFKNSKCCNCFE